MATDLFTYHLDAAIFCVLCAIVCWVPLRWIAPAARRTRWRRPYLAAAVVLPLLSVVAAEWAGERERARLQSMVEGFAPTYALELRSLGALQVDLDTAADDPIYLRLIEMQKAWLGVNPAVADVYTFARRSDGTVALLVDSETDYDRDGDYADDREQRTDIGEDYPASPSLEAAFAGAAVFEADLVTDRWGTWVSAYVPIRRDDGTVHSVLGVDYAASAWIRSILMTRGSVLVVGFLLLSLVVLGHWLLLTSLSRARATAEAQARQQFLAHMSHEIRTPMTAILGYADLLVDNAVPPAERLQCLRTIQLSGRHLLAILDDILDFAKLEAGARAPRLSPTSIAAIVEDVRAVQQQGANRKQLTLTVHIDPALPDLISSDPRMLRQVLLNLVGNAIKFTVLGTIEIDARCTDGDAGQRLRIAVRDSGPGIGPDERARLFQPFTQGQAGLDRPHGGTGLGLSISRRLAFALGGDLVLDSSPGNGSTFTVDLPLIPAMAAAAADQHAEAPTGNLTNPLPATDTASPVATGRRILIVDDAVENRRLLTAILQRAGFGVDGLADGQQCLQRLLASDETPPDLVLMDVQMPGIDGCETTRRLRANGYTGPIVAVTAHAMPEDRAQCLQAGCDDYLTKPIDRPALLATAHRLIAQQRADG